MPRLDKVNIKEVIVFSGDIDNKFEVGKNGVAAIKYKYEDDGQCYSFNLYKADANGKLCLFAVLHRADYIAFDPVEEKDSTCELQDDIDTLYALADKYGLAFMQCSLANWAMGLTDERI